MVGMVIRRKNFTVCVGEAGKIIFEMKAIWCKWEFDEDCVVCDEYNVVSQTRPL